MPFLITYLGLVVERFRSRCRYPEQPESKASKANKRLFAFKPAFVRLAQPQAVPGLSLIDLPIFFAAEDEGRTEEPTPRKREKEREKGRVAKSQEVASSLVVIGGFGVLFFLSGWFLSGLAQLMKRYLGEFNSFPAIDAASMSPILIQVVEDVGLLVAPVFLGVIIMGILGNLIQVGFMFTLKPLAFDFSRIKLDPATMMKRIFFSKQVAMNLVKTLVKVTLLALVGYFIITADYLAVLKTTNMGISHSLQVLGGIAFKLAMVMALILLAMAVPDYYYQKFEFTESIKMTKEEIKEEMKETEGDPLVKQRQRQRAMEFLRRNMFSQVQQADVVITNPTHFAVAIRYDAEKDAAPRVMAKGEDHLAFVIRNLARRAEVPIIENKPLARELYDHVAEGDEVPEHFYRLLIDIFMNLESMRERFAQRAS